VEYELSPYLFNISCTSDFLKALIEGKNPELPKIVIELYLSEDSELQSLRGSNNSEKLDSIGVKLEIVFDDDYKKECEELLKDPQQIKVIPTEYYRVNWYSFANNAVTARSLPIGLSFIDATTIRLQSGTDYYLQNIINSGLDVKERVALAIAYRNLKEQFSSQDSIKGINDNLTQRKGAITDKDLAISIDISQKSNWETSLVPHLDELPFQLVGKGEQNALKIMLALERQAEESHIILIEEPENHLSFSSMNMLVTKIRDKCDGKQIIITTHSAYVLNKLGIEKLILLHDGKKTASLKDLPTDTQDYFRKLSGYDTLRLILAKKALLVEGPSDELIVQKAYLLKHGCLPIEKGVDVINVRGLSFSRFLDIAKELGKEVAVVTDNDGDYQSKVVDKYELYKGVSTIKIYADSDNTAKTLEPQIAKGNSLDLLNKIFGTQHIDVSSLMTYMTNNKTEWALKVFETQESIQIPQYVQDAIA
jgi:ABC-type cobalamin/Fe3+-siderophores transport system ATPase subunit